MRFSQATVFLIGFVQLSQSTAIVQRALGIGAPCDEAPTSCSVGLTCTGPDNHQKCQCNKPKCFSINVNRLSGLPARPVIHPIRRWRQASLLPTDVDPFFMRQQLERDGLW